MNGAAHVFARWNVDRLGDLASRRVISVTAGDGTITAPTTQPAVSTYTANFIRNKEVRLTTSGNHTGVGGSVVATPSPSALAGVSGTYYRERQAFSLDAVPNAGSLLGNWGGSYLYFPAHTTPYRTTFRGPVGFSDTLQTAYEYRASFVDFPLLSIRARSQDGEALGLRATVTRSGLASTDERLPYNGVAWTSGHAGDGRGRAAGGAAYQRHRVHAAHRGLRVGCPRALAVRERDAADRHHDPRGLPIDGPRDRDRGQPARHRRVRRGRLRQGGRDRERQRRGERQLRGLVAQGR